MKNFPPFLTLFFSTLLFSTFLALSSSNWLILWASLELNMLAFIPIISSSSMTNSVDAAVKYFIAQTIGSALFLISALLSLSPTPLTSFFMLLALLLKMGAAPLHFWFPPVASSISWFSLALLTTWQKISPLAILASSATHHSLLILIGFTGILIGGIAGFGQTKYRSIIAFSSISNLGWAIAISQWRSTTFLVFLIYVINILPLMFILKSHNHLSPSSTSMPPAMLLIGIILLVSLAGLPPTSGFISKWAALQLLVNFAPSPFIPYLMIAASLPTIYFYLAVSLAFSQTESSPQHRTNSSLLPAIAIFSIFLVNLVFVLSPIVPQSV